MVSLAYRHHVDTLTCGVLMSSKGGMASLSKHCFIERRYANTGAKHQGYANPFLPSRSPMPSLHLTHYPGFSARISAQLPALDCPISGYFTACYLLLLHGLILGFPWRWISLTDYHLGLRHRRIMGAVFRLSALWSREYASAVSDREAEDDV
jgi:hypothetical protein